MTDRVQEQVTIREALRAVWDSPEFDAVGDSEGLTMMADAVVKAIHAIPNREAIDTEIREQRIEFRDEIERKVVEGADATPNRVWLVYLDDLSHGIQAILGVYATKDRAEKRAARVDDAVVEEWPISA